MGEIRYGMTATECAERCYADVQCLSIDYVHGTAKYVSPVSVWCRVVYLSQLLKAHELALFPFRSPIPFSFSTLFLLLIFLLLPPFSALSHRRALTNILILAGASFRP